MDFITGLPRSKRNNDSIMVVVDKLSKSAHFIPVQSTYRVVQIAHIFMQNIFRLHGLPKTIISDCDVKFTSAFWRTLFGELGTVELQYRVPSSNRWTNEMGKLGGRGHAKGICNAATI